LSNRRAALGSGTASGASPIPGWKFQIAYGQKETIKITKEAA